ncbi:MAG TPA: DUF6790 family protein [Dongiaceae bacterium]|nr:DUF6790 family protein [Dongiaceae bacterium]
MLQVFFALVAFVSASVHVALSAKRRNGAAAVVGTYLIYFLFIYVGLMGLFTAYFHVFEPGRASASIGWAPSPFEYEVGMADLTMGVLGVLCIVFRREFWLATAIGNAVWFLGDAVGHVREMNLHNNHAENNAGIFLVFEFAVPILMLGLVFYHRHLTKEQ